MPSPSDRVNTQNEFPVEVNVDSPHKLVVSWDWHNMDGAVTPPGARLAIEVAQLDACDPDDDIGSLLAATALTAVTVCPTCGGTGTVPL